MTINLIDTPTYDRLVEIQNSYPNLTYQNKGYDYPNKSKWSDEDLKAFEEVKNVLSASIHGFSELNHFRVSTKGELEIRFQYDWSHDTDSIPFTGVGYIRLSELLNGFKE